MFKKRRKEKNQIIEPGKELMFNNRFLLRLLWPLLVEQLLVFAVGLIDSVMVASVGEAAVSAVSLVDSLMILIITVMIALATGGAVVVGQFLGQNKETEAQRTGDQLILFAMMLSLAITIILYLLKDVILGGVFGQIDDDVMAYCNTYYLIVIASIPFISVYNSGAALFRSVGNSKISMKISILMNGINVAGNAILIFGFHRGVEGVAIPTLVSRIIAAVLVIVFLRKPELAVHISKPFCWRPDWSVIKKILRIGIPNGIENSMFQLGKLILLSLISGFGTVSIAANAVSNAVCMIAVLPGMAMGYGVVSIISRCVGAGDYGQVRYYAKKMIKWTYLSMVIINILVVLALPFIIGIYGLSEETGDLATMIILFHSVCAVLIWTPSFTLPNVLRAASDVTFTMIVGVGSMWIFRIGTGILFGKFLGLGLFGVWIAMIVDWAVRALCFILRYRSGKWKHPSVK
ncbi:MAG: MATE family efflux transporter [Bacillota bacterium]|nr:MATE family efflux transporter [Bacillota bacterium]